MGAALLISVGLRRIVALEGEIGNTVDLWRRFRGSLLGCIDVRAAREKGLHRGDGHGQLRWLVVVGGNQELMMIREGEASEASEAHRMARVGGWGEGEEKKRRADWVVNKYTGKGIMDAWDRPRVKDRQKSDQVGCQDPLHL